MEPDKKVMPISGTTSPENSGNNSETPWDRLKPFRFRKGVSGNPGGRPKNLPITSRVDRLMEMPLPPPLRARIENDLEMRLHPKVTFGDAIVLKAVYAMLGHGGLFRIDIFEKFRAITEGPLVQRMELSRGADNVSPDDYDEKKKAVLVKLVDRITERAKAFNMALPALTEMADEAGVDIGIPREDEPDENGKPN